MTKPFEVTDDTFESEVLQAAEPTLVDLWAAWCGPCRMVSPVVEEIAKEYEGKLKVAKLDVDSNQQTPSRYGIRGIPTLLLFKDGAEAVRIVGFRPKEAIIEELLPYIE
ncbi:MAG: thioredoxin [Anaerolineaceae bacterium 4572_32.2]|nr:MAG: thioredoxin [Anaerolineaceae bacterium 4572_32.2]RLC76799.1 MAG: thioredoxin [Chloroflexota bacterium]HEY73164.1 thioredoxin [Thermoflexia bacterium]